MIEITKDNYKDLKFNGVVVSVDKLGFKEDITIHFECAYYSKGKYGYPKRGQGEDNSSFYRISYNTDYLPKGFFFNHTSRLTHDMEFEMFFDYFNFYKFDDMKEFCEWYLKRVSNNDMENN